MPKSKLSNRHSEFKSLNNRTKDFRLVICQTGVLFWVTRYISCQSATTRALSKLKVFNKNCLMALHLLCCTHKTYEDSPLQSKMISCHNLVQCQLASRGARFRKVKHLHKFASLYFSIEGVNQKKKYLPISKAFKNVSFDFLCTLERDKVSRLLTGIS